MMDRGLEPGRLLREPGQHEGAGGDPCDEDRDGDDEEQNEECGHGGVGNVKLEATRGFGGSHTNSAAQAGVTVGGRMSGGAESIEGLPSD